MTDLRVWVANLLLRLVFRAVPVSAGVLMPDGVLYVREVDGWRRAAVRGYGGTD